MRTRLAVPALAIALVACGSSSAASSSAKPPCGPSSAKTLAADRVARVYQTANGVYGCASGGKASYQLAKSGRGPGGSQVGPIALSGRIAGYGLALQGVDTRAAQVIVRRLTDGKQLHSDAATSHPVGPEFFESVGAVVVKTDGSVAWTSSAGSIIRRGAKELEVNKDDSGGHSLLDSGGGIDVASLRLHGSQLSWKDAGRARTATLK